jgi:serpin B
MQRLFNLLREEEMSMSSIRLANLIMIAAVILLPLVSGCGGAHDNAVQVPESSLKVRNIAPEVNISAEQSVVQSINLLGIDMLGTSTDNTVVAPFSASLSMARLQAGAKGETYAALTQRMHLIGITADTNAIFNDLDLGFAKRAVTSASGMKSLNVSSAAWAQKGYGLSITYLDGLAEYFGLKPVRIDFNSAVDSSYSTIATWVSLVSGEFPLYIDITKDTRLVLGNAAQLNVEWIEAFDPGLTAAGGFQQYSGSTVSVSFMRKTAMFPTASGDGYTAYALPLAGNQQFLIVLPDENRFTEIQATLTAERINNIAASLSPQLIDLAIPKFALYFKKSLDLGVAATKGSADFSGIDGTKDLFAASNVHQSRLSMTESGLQASSATLFTLDDLHPETWPSGSNLAFGSITVDSSPVVTVKLGRPFIFAVRDSVSGVILYMGKFMEP